ncbi:MAG TPA: hypothetical protein VFC74_04780, partial [Oscillospiraceae bacterium]|nr:hypothetical protein [Oscillospiraceae bacterium]
APAFGRQGPPHCATKSYPLQAIISTINGQPSAALKRKEGAGFAPASRLSLLAFTGHKCGRLPAALKRKVGAGFAPAYRLYPRSGKNE